MIKREKQIELIKSAEERTKGYLQAWLAVPEFREVVQRRNPARDNGHEQARKARKHA